MPDDILLKQALEGLRSEQIEEMLYNAFVEGKNPGWVKKYCSLSGGASIGRSPELSPVNYIEVMLDNMSAEQMEAFEEAAFRVIGDEKAFMKGTYLMGSLPLTEFSDYREVFGRHLIFIMADGENPAKGLVEGRWARRLMGSIEHESIAEGGIRRGADDYAYQAGLLNGLSAFQTASIPGNAYWTGLDRNPDFVFWVYSGLEQADKKASERYLLKALTDYMGHGPGNNDVISAVQGIVRAHYGDFFLDDSHAVTLENGVSIVLHSYEERGKATRVEYSILDPSRDEIYMHEGMLEPDGTTDIPPQYAGFLRKAVEGQT